jgi:hypothetical protein
MLDTGCWILDTGCWMFDTGYSMLDAGCSMLGACCWIFDSGYLILDKKRRLAAWSSRIEYRISSIMKHASRIKLLYSIFKIIDGRGRINELSRCYSGTAQILGS